MGSNAPQVDWDEAYRQVGEVIPTVFDGGWNEAKLFYALSVVGLLGGVVRDMIMQNYGGMVMSILLTVGALFYAGHCQSRAILREIEEVADHIYGDKEGDEGER